MELDTVAKIRHAVYRLLGTTTDDTALIEQGEAADEVVDLGLTRGIRTAQRWMLDAGHVGWRKRSSAITWSGTDAADAIATPLEACEGALMARLKPEEVSLALKQEMQRYQSHVKLDSVGRVIQVGDGIARIYGLDDAMASELLEPRQMPVPLLEVLQAELACFLIQVLPLLLV